MTPAALDRVFGRSRLKMVTGPYVEVYREATAPGARRRYTKRFISTKDGDFRQWTEREWRILARLVGHGAKHVPDVVQYDRGAAGGDALVQTYDAGVTVDHWATLLPVQRGAHVQRHIFRDCAHWWALARHLLLALHEIHALKLVHLDLKADNICLPFAPPSFHPVAAPERIYPVFEHIALIDFAFSLISGEALTSPLPIGWQRTFPYQSPRLLKALVAGHEGDLEPVRQLDWRCDMFSLAALLTCFLPGPEEIEGAGRERGWTADLLAEARSLLRQIRDSHEHDASSVLPHLSMADSCAARLRSPRLADSLSLGWSLAEDVGHVDATASTAPPTPVTLIEPHLAAGNAVTEIVVRRESAAAAVVGAAIVPAAPTPTWPTTGASGALPGAELAAAATRPAAQAPAQGTHAGPSGVVTTAESALAESAQLVMPEGAAEAGASAPVERAEPSAMATPVTASESLRRRRARLTAWTYGLPLLGLLAVSVWWLSGTENTDSREPSTDTVTAASANHRAQLPDERAAPTPVAEPAKGHPEVEGRAIASNEALVPPAMEDRYAMRAREIVAQVLPIVVERALPRVGEVLAAAELAQNATDDRRTLAAAESIGDAAFSEAELRLTAANFAAQGRQFNAAAHKAFWQGGDVARAFELQWQAFGAQPQDAEIAGNLAFYAMQSNPRRVEMARSLAIYALAAATRSTGPSRLEDWGSLAVASALSGRSSDSTNAMLVLLTVSKDVNRSCRSALSSVASFGPAMKAPAQALLSRVNARGAASGPHCAWPPRWTLGSKVP